MQKKIQKGLQIIVQGISGIIAVFVLITLLFTKLNREGVVFDFAGKILLENYANNLILFIFVGFFIWLWMRKNGDKKVDVFDSSDKKRLLISSVLLFAAQIFFVYHIYFYAGNDALNIRIGAENFVNGIYDHFYNFEYYQNCPNNLMAYMIYIIAYYIAKGIGWCDGYVLLVGCNILLANVAVLLVALSAYKLTESKRCMWLAYGLSVLLFGITPWLSVPYTDMLSIATPIVSFYIYLCLREKSIPAVVKWGCIFIVPFLMYGLKPLNIIIAIAIVLCEILYFEGKKEGVKSVVSLLVSFLLVIAVVFGVQTGIEKYVGYEENKDQEFSFVWVLFLGSDDSTYGQWSFENLQYALQFDTQEERQKELIKVTVERVVDRGFKGNLNHWMNKVHMFYNDGNFGWGTTGSLVAELPQNEGGVSQFMRNLVYPPENYGLISNYPGYGEYFQYYAVAKQFVWLLVFVFMTIRICWPTKDKYVLVLKTTWIGVFLFTMLFETHARLLVSFLPIFVLMASIGARKK